MNKLSKSILIALLASGCMVGPAFAASQIDVVANTNNAVDSTPLSAPADLAGFDVVGAATGAITVAKELLAGDVDVFINHTGLVAGRDIIYSPDIALGDLSTIVLTVTNGAIKATAANDFFLINLNAGAGDQTQMKMVDFTVDANGNYTTLLMKVDSSLTTAGVTPGTGDNLVLSETDEAAAALIAPTFVVNAGMIGADVTLQVTSAADATSTSLNAPLTAKETILTAIDGLSCDVTVTLNTIDVEADPSRADFLVVDPTVNSSTSSVKIVKEANVTFALDTAGDAYDVAISTSTTNAAITGVTFNANATDDTVANVWTFSTDAVADVITADVNTVITVDGIEPMNTSSFGTTVTFTAFNLDNLGNPVPAAASPATVCNNVTANTWKINGAQFIVPYVSTNEDYGVHLLINNASSVTTPAEVSIDVIASTTGDVVSNIPAGTIAPLTHRYVSAEELQGLVAAAIPSLDSENGSNRYGIRVTVTSPAADVTATAMQNESDGTKRTVPTLTARDSDSWGF